MTNLPVPPRPAAPRPPQAPKPQTPTQTAPTAPVPAAPTPPQARATAPKLPTAVPAKLPDPGPPAPRTSGGLARTSTDVQPYFMQDVDVQQDFNALKLSGDAHLTWLREQFTAQGPEFHRVQQLARQMMEGQHVLLRGPEDLTRNVDAALRATLRLVHRVEAKTCWTHTPEQLCALQGTVRATLVLGGHTRVTYTFRFDGEAVTVTTTQGERTTTRDALRNTFYGSYFTNVQQVEA